MYTNPINMTHEITLEHIQVLPQFIEFIYGCSYQYSIGAEHPTHSLAFSSRCKDWIVITIIQSVYSQYS